MPFIPQLAMHIPDGFVSLPFALVGWVIAAALIAVALHQTRDRLGERQIPLMGVLAAFVFAAQMINFPVAGGTSGHMIGGALVGILLGPWAGVLVMTTVVGVQALLFQDGGLLALGFNIVNMGVISVFLSYTVYTWARRVFGESNRTALIAAALGAWLSVETAALAASLELAISGTSPLDVALPAMLGVHALIGLGEAAITVAALSFILQTRPDLMSTATTRAARGSAWIAAGLVIALAVAFASPLASADPDGLEKVAEDKEFIDEAEDAPYEILPDYTIPFIENEAATTIAAGIVGVLVVAVLGWGTGRANRETRPEAVRVQTPR